MRCDLFMALAYFTSPEIPKTWLRLMLIELQMVLSSSSFLNQSLILTENNY